MRQTSRVVAAVLALAMCGSGCGTIFGWSSAKPVKVTSRPSDGAKIYVDGVDSGQMTPGTIELKPDKTAYSVVCEKGDMKSGGTNVSRDLRTEVVLLNLLDLELFLFVDYMTGALYSFPDAVNCNMGTAPVLPPEPPPEPAKPPKRPDSTTTDLNRANEPPPAKRMCKVCGGERGDGPTCKTCGAR